MIKGLLKPQGPSGSRKILDFNFKQSEKGNAERLANLRSNIAKLPNEDVLRFKKDKNGEGYFYSKNASSVYVPWKKKVTIRKKNGEKKTYDGGSTTLAALKSLTDFKSVSKIKRHRGGVKVRDLRAVLEMETSIDPEIKACVQGVKTPLDTLASLKKKGSASQEKAKTQAQEMGKALAERLLASQDHKVACVRQDLLLSSGETLISYLSAQAKIGVQGGGRPLSAVHDKEVQAFFKTVVDTALFELSDGKMAEDKTITLPGGKTYALVEKVGAGGFGAVTIYQNTGNPEDRIVLKSLKEDERTPQEMNKAVNALGREIDVHAQVGMNGDPHIIQCIAPVRDREGTLMFAMEYAPHGDVSNKIEEIRKKVKEGTLNQGLGHLAVLLLSRDMTMALQEFQRQKGIHYDFKTPNFFIGSGGIAKLGDFGTSGVGDTLDITTIEGVDNPEWKAPEGVDGKTTPIGQAYDNWALGVSFYDLFNGSLFDTTFQYLMKEKLQGLQNTSVAIGKNGFFTEKSTGNANIDKIINGLLKRDPEHRMPVGDVVTELEKVIDAYLNEPGHEGLTEADARKVLMGIYPDSILEKTEPNPAKKKKRVRSKETKVATEKA